MSLQKLAGRLKDKQIVVPTIKQPLFDPLSKALIEPGSEIRPLVADDTWLIQKHCDTLQDFVDVDPAEKEYMKEWDSFILRKRISSDAYFARAFLQFVQEKGPWLAAKKSRLQEFGKHLSVLIARGSLKNDTIKGALALINEAKAQKRPCEVPSQSPKDACYKSVGGCTICGLPVLGPSMLICSNKVRPRSAAFAASRSC